MLGDGEAMILCGRWGAQKIEISGADFIQSSNAPSKRRLGFARHLRTKAYRFLKYAVCTRVVQSVCQEV